MTTFQEQRDNPGWAVVVGLRLSGFQLPLRSGIISTASPTTVATIMCIASICASPCACCAQSFDRNPPPPLPLPCTASFFHQFVRTCENCILCIFTYLVSHASDIHHAEHLYIHTLLHSGFVCGTELLIAVEVALCSSCSRPLWEVIHVMSIITCEPLLGGSLR